MSSSKLRLLLGAAAGAGVGVGTLAMWHRPSARPDVEAVVEGLRRADIPEGEIELSDPMRRRTRILVRDPLDQSVVQIHRPEQPGAPTAAASADVLRHLLGGPVEQFLRAYSVVGTPRVEETPFGRATFVEWRKDGCDGCASRQVWFNASWGILRLEERSADGHVFRSVAYRAQARPRGVRPMAPERETSPPRLSERNTADFQEFVRAVPLAIYEPASLPPGFIRHQYGFDDRPPRSDPGGEPLPIAWIVYTDGMIRMNLFLAAPEQMRRLEDLARRQDAGPVPSACPTTEANAPEDLLAEGAVTIHRKMDGCRTILRRTDLQGVVVALVGYPGLPHEAYVRTIRGLVPVPRPSTDEAPLREVR